MSKLHPPCPTCGHAPPARQLAGPDVPLRLNAYAVIKRAAEEGSSAGWWGWLRAVEKDRIEPPREIPEWLWNWLNDERVAERAAEVIADRVMEALDEVVKWDDGPLDLLEEGR